MCESEKFIEITEEEFERFKAEFDRLTKLFGLMQYKVYFEQKYLESSFGLISINEVGKIASVYLTTKLEDENINSWGGPEDTAKHEALHLLTSRLQWLGTLRETTEDQLGEEWEALVRVLERFDYREPLTESDEKRKKHETEILIESMKRDF